MRWCLSPACTCKFTETANYPQMKQVRSHANISKRVIATLVDYFIYFFIFSAYVIFFGVSEKPGSYSVSGVMALPLSVFWFIYFPVAETWVGQTLGHRLMGLSVISVDGTKVSFGQALKRRGLDVFDIFASMGLVAFIVVKNTDLHQRVGDLLAKTMVVDNT